MESAIIGLNEVIILFLLIIIAIVGFCLYKIITKYTKTNITTTSPAKPGKYAADVLTQLERLGKLKDEGKLNETEFEQQKKKILE